MALALHHAAVAEIEPETLYRLLWLRVSVFVVEQRAAYPEIDGRDIEPGAELLWAEEDGLVLATARLLREADALRIGRVATAPEARGRGVASAIMRAAIDRCERVGAGLPIVLDAQEHLLDWYAGFGFVAEGDRFFEDDIAHRAMRRV
ncbi:GNAT family N-acetyltransferase [Agromyces aerolatus]|uniref:GNAT family N-acetyltransferase n=1 Tax=Agromyces sp. LY-1074 TaxID=3074080 RepID=UPI002859EC3E|nr:MULTISPECIES: GNAT family N-acetyltransferase [unclassified Agromyces]MDR5699385.1 GNAT family N-acetyltransferase [Agromyces sp. LY-1074]MDR5705681.1 GNAT family N-acetyltransferase [Agromyces sp. LY-1358]